MADEPVLDEANSGGGLNPVIWVHGCPPPVANAEVVSHFTDAQRSFFESKGYPSNLLYRFVYSGPQCDSSRAYAAELAALVDEARAASGRSKVDIVAHSMGAVAARLYIAEGGDEFVKHLVTLAGTSHGTETGAPGIELQAAFGAPAFEGMKELFPPYACTGQASGGAEDIQFQLNGCLTLTGRSVFRDETPEDVKYLSIRNTLDGEVIPVESGCLDQKFQNDCSNRRLNQAVTVPPGPGCGGTCPGHVTMLFDPNVIQKVFDFISE